MLSTGAIKLFSHLAGGSFDAWGWRIPFALSIVLVAIGLYVRLRVLETPALSEVKRERAVVKMPVLQVFMEQPREVISSAFVRMSEQAPFYLFVTFVLTYGTDHLKLSDDSLLNDVIIAAAISLVSTPLFGYLSDRIGRRLMYGIGIICIGAFAFPLLLPAQHQSLRADPARRRAVARVPRHAVRAAGIADRGKLRARHPLQRRRRRLRSTIRFTADSTAGTRWNSSTTTR